MERVSKRLYMREHSNVIRKFQSVKQMEKMEENPIFNIEGTNRLIIITICRIRQRMLTQAWRILTKNTGVLHDYETDAKIILSRKLPEEELRTELEIEVLFKWIYMTKDKDPTGIANSIFLCKKRSAIYNALQQMRLEFYEPGETVLFQGDIPRSEDGHFTIFNGVCEVLQFPEDSMPLMKLLYLAKKKKWDEAKKLLQQAIVLARISKASGFGELSTLTGVKRAATIRTDPNSTVPVEIIVLPKQALLDCLKSRRQDGVEGAAPSEAMDFMRQSGLANRISPKDLVLAAQSMVRRTLMQGEILYYKNETVKSLFLVVSGELLLDTGDFMYEGKPQAFVNTNPDHCYHMSSGSILGDEGVTGQSNRFASTAVVVSDAAVVFEAVGFGMTFLTEKIGALRYCALTYRDKTRWSAPVLMAEEINPYTYFHSLRKAIAYTHPYRGSQLKIYEEYVEDKNISKTPNSANLTRRPTSKTGKMGKHPITTSTGKKLSPLVRLDSNLAYMLSVDHSSNPKQVTEFQFPRTLKPVGLHHALDINRNAKKLAQKFVKIHAQENILYDQMTKELLSAPAGKEQSLAELKFQTHITEYRERAVHHAAQVQREMEQERLSKAYSASAASVRFHGTLSPDSSVDGSQSPTHTTALRRRGFSKESGREGVDMEEVVQSRPFTSTTQQLGDVNEEKEKEECEDVGKAGNTTSSNQLNVRNIEKELRDALMKHDVEFLRPTAETTVTMGSLQTYEDEYFHSRPKIIQYFIWMDNLNRHTYRALLQQAQATLDQSHNRASPQKLAVTNQTMEELNNIFNRFGLTPTDMNIPWRPGSPKTGLAHFDDNSDEEDEIGSLKALGVNKSRPSTSNTPSTPVPVLELPPVRSNNATTTTTTEGHKQKVNPSMWGRVDKDKQEQLDRIKLQGKFKAYNPSTWRHELIMKKEKGAAKETFRTFSRSPIPDNRRVCGRYYQHPGHHNAEAASKEGTYRGMTGFSRPNSRPGTGQGRGHARQPTEEFLETDSTIERREAHEERLLDLQANFNVLPEKFMEAVKEVHMPKRREHLPNKQWNTRYMRSTVELLPGESCAPQLAERMMQKQASRSIPSDSFSKTAMLNNARSMLQRNHDTYALTDSVSILEASLERGMLRTMKSAKNNRNSILGLSAKNLTAVAAVPVKPQQKLLPQDALRCYTEDSRDDMSVGNLSAGMEGEEEYDRLASDRRGSKQEGALEDDRSKHVGFTGEEASHAENSTRSGASDTHILTPLELTTGKHNPVELTTGKHSPVELATTTDEIPHGFIEEDPHQAGMLTRDDQSLENSMLVLLDPTQLSPVAPAPSHIDENAAAMPHADKNHLDEDYTNSAISTYRSDSAQEQHLHFSLPPPLLGLNSLDTRSPLPGSTPAAVSNKAADASALRLKELREKIIAHAPSDALGQFNNYMRTDNNPRKFYEGKKKASLYSKYGLISSMRSLDSDISKPSAAEIELLGARKSTLNTEMALFNSLFPDCTEEQRQEYIESSRKRRAEEAAGAARTAALASLRGGSTDTAVTGNGSLSLSEGAHLSVGTGTTQEKGRTGLLSRTALEIEREGLTGQGSKMPTLEECEELDLDPDVVVWQRFTVDVMHKEKGGPKKILPVLIMKNESGASSKRFAVNKSKRWGSGVLLQLASKAEEEPIAGPSSYLEIFKGTQRRKLREKDRKRITDELHTLLK